MIKVYQIQDQEALHPACTFTYGMPVSSAFKPGDHLDKYVHVADLDVETLNEAFEVGNIGPEEKYTRFSSMHSVSIGDILELDGEKFIVGRRGFDSLKEVI
tara:strand:- start:106 stop:408 length:303 start_codon:yes stop_codon:yes gene_type:complete